MSWLLVTRNSNPGGCESSHRAIGAHFSTPILAGLDLASGGPHYFEPPRWSEPASTRRAYVVINQLIVSVVPAGGTVPRSHWASLLSPVLAILLTSVESGPRWSNNVSQTEQHRQVLGNTKLTSRYEKVMNYCEVEQSYEQTQAGSGSQEDWWGRGYRGDQERRRSRARWGQSSLLST